MGHDACVTHASPSPSHRDDDEASSRLDAAGIYGLIVTASVIATGGDTLRTTALVVAVVVTLVVYWLAEQYAEFGAHLANGNAPSGAHARHQLRSRWQMITVSFVPLASILLARLLGATSYQAAIVGLLVTVALLMAAGWHAGRAAGLHGRAQALMTLAAGGLGLIMIALKIALGHLH